MLFFSHWHSYKKLVDHKHIVYFWTLSFIPLLYTSMSIHVPILYCLSYHCFVENFEIRKCESSYFILFQGCFDYPGSLAIPFKFVNQLANLKNSARILIGIVLNMHIIFRSIIMLCLPIPEHGKFFHLFRSSFILSIMFYGFQSSFISCLPFLVLSSISLTMFSAMFVLLCINCNEDFTSVLVLFFPSISFLLSACLYFISLLSVFLELKYLTSFLPLKHH